MPTIRDVAARAGVSKTTVSFVLNGRPGIGEATRVRVLAAADELGWRPSKRARALSTSRSGVVALVIARPAETLRLDPFFATFIAGVEAELAAADRSLLLRFAPEPGSDLAIYRRLVTDRACDGVLLTDVRVRDDRLPLLAELDLPAVVVGERLPGADLPSVGIDDRCGIDAATRHLIGLGHTRIGHIGGPPEVIHGRSRREAWESALLKADLSADLFVASDFSARGGAAATSRLLRRAKPPTAIVYANDIMALAGVSRALALGRRVPEDLSVTGFDNTELGAHVHPPLTSVHVDVQAWGAAAARALLALVDGQEPPQAQLPGAKLVVRASTAPPGPASPTDFTRSPSHPHDASPAAPSSRPNRSTHTN